MALDAVAISQLTGRSCPLNLLDQVTEMDEEKVTAISNVSFSQSFFQGHFPNNPVMPGVLIIEALSQACQLLLKSQKLDKQLTKIRKAKFREMVKPGDQLIIKVEQKDELVFKAQAYTKDKLACSAEISFN